MHCHVMAARDQSRRGAGSQAGAIVKNPKHSILRSYGDLAQAAHPVGGHYPWPSPSDARYKATNCPLSTKFPRHPWINPPRIAGWSFVLLSPNPSPKSSWAPLAPLDSSIATILAPGQQHHYRTPRWFVFPMPSRPSWESPW